jgi:hypothetical protein
MRKRRVGLLAVLGVAAAFFIAGCGGGGGGGGEQGSSEGSGGPTVSIVSDFPLQGSSRPQNETIVNAINLALEQRTTRPERYRSTTSLRTTPRLRPGCGTKPRVSRTPGTRPGTSL